MRPLSISFLPSTLLALCLALPVFSSSPAPAAPTTPFNAFQAVVSHARKQPEPPVCCLKPLPSLDHTEEEVLLSFEEWKAKQLSAVQQEQAAARNSSPGLVNNSGNNPAAEMPLEANASAAAGVEGGAAVVGTGVALEQPAAPPVNAPYFRIPLTDRFNYASTDCSARVHTAHRGAKSASAILSSKKDRYMLSPCAARGQFVVVELCDDIRIDTVQLANHEFFSGVFRDFEVWVAKTYATDTDGWTFAGTYRAQNVRGVQSFHPPTTLTDFYRFIRIDFHSHYGNEYYCPVSLLRVYGLTHLEHWKWDLWEAESRAKRTVEDPGANTVGPVEVAEKPPQPVHVSTNSPVEALPKTSLPNVPVTTSDGQASQHLFAGDSTISGSSNPSGAANGDVNTATPSPESTILDTTISPSVGTTSVHDAGEAARSKASTPPPLIQPPALLRTKTENELPDVKPAATSTHHEHVESQNSDTNHDSSRTSTTDSLYNTVSSFDPPTSASASVSLSSPSLSSSASPLSTASTLQSSAPVSSASTALSISSLLSSLNLSAQASRLVSASASFSASLSTPGTAPANPSSQSLTISPPPPPPPVAAPASSGESIYRTIMNRLIALETNTTLYARFVEDHTANVRDMLRRLSEDIGRLEGIGRQQAHNYQRSVAEFQRQQRRLELEHKELMLKVVHLTDEVVLEKRLGIAQLCLLLTVLVFMALTRGSRSELMQGPVNGMRSRTTSLRGWGTRTLNLSGEWVNKLKNGNRPLSMNGHDHEPIRSSEKGTEDLSSKGNSPSQSVQTMTEVGLRNRRSFGPTLASPRRLGFPVRPHTPSSARIPRHHSPQYYPTTPTAATVDAAPPFATGARPQVQRVQSGGSVTQSLSMGVLGPVPRSAKRWARTAHIHQVKNAPSRHSASGVDFSERAGAGRHDREEGDVDVFGTPAMRSAPSVSDAEHDSLPVVFPSVAAGSETSEGDGTQWEDTDAEGSDLDISR